MQGAPVVAAPECRDPLSACKAAPLHPITSGVSAVAPVRVTCGRATGLRRGVGRGADRGTDSRDAKMIVKRAGNKFASYYYAGKKKCCLGEDFLSYEAAVIARRRASQHNQPSRLRKAEARAQRRAAGGAPVTCPPCIERHYTLLELLVDKLGLFGLEVRIVAKRESFWEQGASILVRPTVRDAGDDKFAAIKVKHCGKITQGGVRFKDLGKVTTDHLLCVFANNDNPGDIQRTWLFPTKQVAHYACLYMGMSDSCIAGSKWQQQPYAMSYLAQLGPAVQALPRTIDPPSE